jgi:hypothetical protein
MKIRYFYVAMCLAAIVVLLEITLFFYNRSNNFAAQSELLFRVVGALCLVLGLWLQSSVARFCGGAFLAMTFVGAAWAVFTANGIAWALILFWLFYALVGLLGAYILLMSNEFAAEFRYLRETRPRHKVILARIFLAAVILLAAVATIVDVYRLAGEYTTDGAPSIRIR